MKIKNYKMLLFLFALIYSGCSLLLSLPEVEIKNGFDGNGIAVLNFSTKGSYLTSDIGQVAADRFTDALFITNNFNVVDRAQVNEAQKSLEISSTEFLSEDDIQKLGSKLKSRFLVLGRIQQVSRSEFLNSDKQLYISFRIISVANSEVVGVGKHSSDYNDDLVKKVETMVYDLVDRIELE